VAASRLRGAPDDASDPRPPPDPSQQRDLSQAVLPHEGIEIFRRVLARDRLAQVVVSTQPLPALIEQIERLSQAHLQGTEPGPQVGGARHARANLRTAYVAPRSQVEARLAAIWQDLLRIDRVGVHDNFFELGGDSVLGIQVVARVRGAGLQVEPEQLFEYQTVAELAQALQPGAMSDELDLPLTPGQLAWLADDVHQPYVLVLESSGPLEVERLEQAFEQLGLQHDALRLGFTRDETGWRQVLEDRPVGECVTRLDLSDLDAGECSETIEAEVVRLRRSQARPEPPLARAVYVQLGPGRADRLLLAVSPLSADEAAWPILLEDLAHAYARADLGAPSATFADWARWAANYARSDELQAQRAYWQSLAGQLPVQLPVDGPSPGSAPRRRRSSLPSRRLAREAWRAWAERSDAQLEHVLLCALARVIARWSQRSNVLIGVSDHQRGLLPGNLDTRRTVGWLRADYPLYLDLPASDDWEVLLKAVKEQSRRARQAGLGYAYLCAAGEIEAIAPPITLTWVPAWPEAGRLGLVQLHSPDGRQGALHLNVAVVEGQLQLDWCYEASLYRRETVVGLSDELAASLEALGAHAREHAAAEFTPSDFPESGLDQASLDRLLAQFDRKG
jgi:aryl carrier-like protein